MPFLIKDTSFNKWWWKCYPVWMANMRALHTDRALLSFWSVVLLLRKLLKTTSAALLVSPVWLKQLLNVIFCKKAEHVLRVFCYFAKIWDFLPANSTSQEMSASISLWTAHTYNQGTIQSFLVLCFTPWIPSILFWFIPVSQALCYYFSSILTLPTPPPFFPWCIRLTNSYHPLWGFPHFKEVPQNQLS